jgi:light-regulated signal transduction histidine kinase (bacteriophytochrome)
MDPSAVSGSDREFGVFASVIAHELRSPLQVASASLELLEQQRDGLPDRVQVLLGHLGTGVHRAGRVLDALQYYAATERAVLRREMVDCNSVVAEVLGELSSRIADRDAAIECNVLPVVEGDRAQLGQVFHNLVANGLKFNESPRPVVSVEGAACESGWEFAVTDNGVGVSPERAERIFGMFERGHDPYEGTGVGLAVCAVIVERHGGRIWVEPATPRGSVFRFTLARQVPDR